MNKAFVREPEGDDGNCPHCGARGESVERRTVEAMVTPEVLDRLAQTASYCPTPNCEVVYFDAFERVVTTAELVRPVYPKDPDAPICPCYGATTDLIDQDLAEGTVERTRRLVEQARSPATRCMVMSVTGRSCAAEVQRYYMRRRSNGVRE
jgi:hypothetical protein